MKAQRMFGGTNLKQTGTKVRQVGTTGSSSGGGLDLQRRTRVKQVGTTTKPAGNTSQMVRDPHWSTKASGRPTLPGKVDNRQGKGNGQ